MYLTLTNTLHSSFFTIALICGILLQAYLPGLCVAPTIIIVLYLASIGIYILHTYTQNNYLTTRALMTLGIICMGGLVYQHQQTNHATFHAYIDTSPFDMIGTVTNILPIRQGHIKQRLTIQVDTIKKTKPSMTNTLAKEEVILDKSENGSAKGEVILGKSEDGSAKEGVLADKQQKTTIANIKKSIHLHTSQIMDAQVGDRIEVTNLICKPPKKNSFDTYMIKEKIAATIFTQAPTWQLIERPAFSPRRYIHNATLNLTAGLQKKLSRGAFSLFSSLFLGDTVTCKKQLERTKDQFRAWGIMHYLARSGLHLIIFIAVWQTLLCILPLPFLLKQLIMLLLSLIYFALSWSSISFMRALYTFILYKICILHKRPSHLVYLLSLVCFFVLLDNPMQLFFLDFQLSFTLTFALALFNQISACKNN